MPRRRVNLHRLGRIREYVGLALGCVCVLHVGGAAAVPVEHELVSEMKAPAGEGVGWDVGRVLGAPCGCCLVAVAGLGSLGWPWVPRSSCLGGVWGGVVWWGTHVAVPGRGCHG